MMTQHEEHLLRVAQSAAIQLRLLYTRGDLRKSRPMLNALMEAEPQIEIAIRKNQQGAEVMAQVNDGTIKPIDEDVDRYNCHGCGRFLTDKEREENEVRCMGCA